MEIYSNGSSIGQSKMTAKPSMAPIKDGRNDLGGHGAHLVSPRGVSRRPRPREGSITS